MTNHHHKHSRHSAVARHHHVSHPHAAPVSAHRHHHVNHPHHAHRPTHHQSRHHGANPFKEAFHFVSDGIVKPVWQDVVKPIVKLPSEALHTIDNTEKSLTSGIVPVALGAVAIAVLLRR